MAKCLNEECSKHQMGKFHWLHNQVVDKILVGKMLGWPIVKVKNGRLQFMHNQVVDKMVVGKMWNGKMLHWQNVNLNNVPSVKCWLQLIAQSSSW